MQAALPYIVLLQLFVSLVMAVLVFALARQIGILHERVAPMGALVSDHGPAVGELAPRLDVETLAGRPMRIGGPNDAGRSRLLLFVSPSCPVCKKLLPIAGSFARAERVNVVLVGDGNPQEQRRMLEHAGVEALDFVNSAELGLRFQVGKLPYAILLDAEGVIRAKGLVNQREHLESLLVAEESGFGSIQSYLAAKSRVADQGLADSRELSRT